MTSRMYRIPPEFLSRKRNEQSLAPTSTSLLRCLFHLHYLKEMVTNSILFYTALYRELSREK